MARTLEQEELRLHLLRNMREGGVWCGRAGPHMLLLRKCMRMRACACVHVRICRALAASLRLAASPPPSLRTSLIFTPKFWI